MAKGENRPSRSGGRRCAGLPRRKPGPGRARHRFCIPPTRPSAPAGTRASHPDRSRGDRRTHRCLGCPPRPGPSRRSRPGGARPARIQACPVLEDRRLRRRRPRVRPARGPGQPIRRLSKHVLTGALQVQSHPDREVRLSPAPTHPMPCFRTPAAAITSSTTFAGNTRVSRPTDAKSGNRRSKPGFLQPVRGIPQKYRTEPQRNGIEPGACRFRQRQ